MNFLAINHMQYSFHSHIATILKNLLIFFPFVLPVSTYYAIVVFDAICVFWLLSGYWQSIFQALRRNYLAIAFIIFWLLHVVSLLYSIDIKRGGDDVLQKVSFLLFPVIITSSGEILKGDVLKRVFLMFNYGLLATTVLCVVNAVLISFTYSMDGLRFIPYPMETPWENYFFYDRLSEPRHPLYLAMYFSLGIAMLFWLIKYKQQSGKDRLFFASLIFLFSTMIILLVSRSGILSGIGVLLLGGMWLLRKKSIWLKVLLPLVLVTSISVFMWNNSRFSNILRGVQYFLSESNMSLLDNEKKLMGEDFIRLRIWYSFPQAIEGHWLTGFGVGDTKNALVTHYEKRGIQFARENRLNMHNQFLESILGVGILGGVLLLFIFGYLLYQAIKHKDMLLGMFFMILLINSLFESILERIAGVFFFAFFGCLLLMKDRMPMNAS